jgi:hypothetical protein
MRATQRDSNYDICLPLCFCFFFRVRDMVLEGGFYSRSEFSYRPWIVSGKDLMHVQPNEIIMMIFVYRSAFDLFPGLKGLSHEMDFNNVDEN